MTRTRFEVVAAPPDGLLAGALGRRTTPVAAVLPDLDLEATIRLAESAGLRGRGGAGFPVARKLAAVATEAGRMRLHRRPVVVVNAAEGEPASGKDAALLQHSPYAVLAGARLLARAIGTTDIRVWAPGHDAAATRSIAAAGRAVSGRRGRGRVDVTVVEAPDRFVAGEGSAAARGVSRRDPVPRTDGVRTSCSGVAGRPTLVLNAETVAQLGRLAGGLTLTRLVTVLGAVAAPGVVEVPNLVPVSSVLAAGGGILEPVRALLLGGYHGRWYGPDALELVLGTPDGPLADCSIVAALPDHACLLGELDSVAAYLAGESAGQCGPCAFGLPEMARSVRKALVGGAEPMRGATAEVVGRGGCHHPDGSVRFVASGLATLAHEVAEHARGACRRPWRQVLPVPGPRGMSVAATAPTILAGGAA